MNFKDMEDIVRQLANVFIGQIPDLLQDLSTAFRKENAKEVEVIAHKLCGSLSSFFAEPAQSICYQMEKLARESKLPEAQKLLPSLEESLEVLKGELELIAQTGRLE